MKHLSGRTSAGLALALETGVTSTRGFTLVELLIGLAIIGIISATAIPVFISSSARNAVWTATELVGSQIRLARLQAISHNSRFRVRFDCPSTGNFRVLAVTENPAIDDAADRCDQTEPFDSGVLTLPAGVSFGTVPTLEVNGRGIYSGSPIPRTITVTNGESSRALTVTFTGQITFETY
jgi:prepilin-type N-terminal cleavage/methylation domain-containing protein